MICLVLDFYVALTEFYKGTPNFTVVGYYLKIMESNILHAIEGFILFVSVCVLYYIKCLSKSV